MLTSKTKRLSSLVPFSTGSNALARWLTICWAILASHLLGVPFAHATEDATPSKTHSEYWVGWMETADRQLRWIVQFNRSESNGGPIVSAYTWNPDISSKPNPLTKFEINDQYWKLEWDQSNGKESLKYEAIQESETRATGFIIINDKTLAVPLNKVLHLPEETARNLGADIVWLDQLPPSPQNTNAKRFDLRLRFYTEGPFAVDGPRILLDSMTAQLVGVPVELAQNEEDYLQFQIPSIKANYRAMLDESEERMSGTFQRNDTTSELVLHLLKEQSAASEDSKAAAPAAPTISSTKTSSENATAKSSDEPPAMPEKTNATDAQNTETVKINIRGAMPSKLAHDLSANEKAFTLDTDIPKTTTELKAANGAATTSRILGGTISYSTVQPEKPSPAIVILSTYDANDRDGSIGASKFYKQLAAWFASQGIASVRIDDRGVGESQAFENMTTDDQERDLKAVIEMLRNDPKIASDRIGLFGHGEGADRAMRLAATDGTISFSILFAPPGVNGFELTKQRLVFAAIAQGIAKTDAEQLSNFQRALQEIALRSPGDRVLQVQQIKQLVADNWNKIGPLTGASAVLKDADERAAVESRILAQVAGFDTPLVRDALVTEPATNWMLGSAPTLVMFGGSDGIIRPDVNAEPLKSAALRGGEGRFQFVELPQVNHWFNSSNASSNDTEDKEVAIDGQVFTTISNWIQRRGL